MTPEETVDLILSKFPLEIPSFLEKEVLKELIIRGFEVKNIQVERYDFFTKNPNCLESSILLGKVVPITLDSSHIVSIQDLGQGFGCGSFLIGRGGERGDGSGGDLYDRNFFRRRGFGCGGGLCIA